MRRSPSITWDQLRVGLVIALAVVVVGVAIYKLGQAANLFTKRYHLTAFLPDANGLREGGTVTVAGQLAGTVTKIEFLPVDSDTTRNLRLTLAVDANVRDQIRKDSKGKLRTMGLLGDKVFDITTGTPRYQPLRDGDTVTVVPSIDYEAVIAQASGAVNDMVALTKDLRAITGGLVKGQGTLGQMLTNRALYDQLNGTLSRANTMLARFQNPNGTVGRMLDDPLLYERLVSVVSSTDSLMRQLTNGQGTASRLLTDQTLYDQLNKLVTDLSAVVADVRRDPGRYTKGMVKVF
jgi:phospholipid/cholesterol/gamma-HCH transport system substrate-binding protein